MIQAWLRDFMAEERLPETFRLSFEAVCKPLADQALQTRERLGRTAVIGLCGAQGSGKSTIAAATVRLLRDEGLNAVVLALDDLYLSAEARAALARDVHPLLRTRGPPGTHDVDLGIHVLNSLSKTGALALPRFDKARDARRPPEDWPIFDAPADVVIFEGWCVGARPQPPAALTAPINALERQEDPDGRWRAFVNAALAGPYQALFATLDRFVLLQAPSFEVVANWRAEQEDKLRARTGEGMAAGDIARFVAHYERLTRWILQDAPARADWVVPLGVDRAPSLT